MARKKVDLGSLGCLGFLLLPILFPLLVIIEMTKKYTK